MDARNNNFDFDFTPIGQAIKCAYRKAECEAAVLAELKPKCEKNGWDYQQKANEYREKTAGAMAKAEEKRQNAK